MTQIKRMKSDLNCPHGTNQAAIAFLAPSSLDDFTARDEAGAKSIFGAHRRPLSVTDNFEVLDDPVQQQDFTTFHDADGPASAESVLMLQGVYCAACADTMGCALLGLPGVQRA